MADEDGEEIVTTYRKRNPAPCPPTPETLRRHSQCPQHSGATLGGNENEDVDQSQEEERPVEKKRAPRHSKGPKESSPRTVSFYPPGWKAVLNNSKAEFQCYIAAENAFPTRQDDMDDV